MSQPIQRDEAQSDAALTATGHDLASVGRLYRLARLLSLDLVVEKLARLALRELSEAIGCRRCSMLLLSDDLGDVLIESCDRPEGSGGLQCISDEQEIPVFLVPTRGKVTEHILRTRVPMLVEDATQETRFGAQRERAYPSKAFASAPLIVDARVLAILNATDKEGDKPITADDLRLLEIFAAQLALKLKSQLGDVEDLFRRAYEATRLRVAKRQMAAQLDEAVRVASRRKAQLSSVSLLSGMLQTGFVLEELAKMIVKLVMEASGATKVSVLILDDRHGDLLTRAVAGAEATHIQRLRQRGKVTERIIQEKRPILVEGSGQKPAGQASSYQTDSYVVVPVLRGDNVEAIISATDKQDRSSFDKEDLRFLDIIAAQVAVTLGDFQARELVLRQRALEGELRIAGEVQRKLFPVFLPSPRTARLAVRYRPAGHVGGDYYGVLDLGNDRYGIVIADVSGKGIPAALVMVMISTYLTTLGFAQESTGELMTELNRYLEGCVEKNMFVTMAYALFDARKRQLSFTNAGHPAPLLLRAGAPGPVELPQSSFPLAVFTEAEFETSTVQLEPGDLFVMYTDGLT
ncbi:MAG: GAF domain-containing protein, partial [Planctomycetes bacterium]|nr:GAF domain-containing protein [Planctomycetota bacterium]